MDEKITRIIRNIQNRDDLAQFEINARKLGALTTEMAAAIGERRNELGVTENRSICKSTSVQRATGDIAHRSLRNPPWSRNELILALALYMRLRGTSIAADNVEVAELATVLGKLGRISGRDGIDTFRNANGVRMKLMNFRRFDPLHIAEGTRGLSRGNKLEEGIWNEFFSDAEGLANVVHEIRAEIQNEP